jgi:hypothetical protein
MISFTPHPSRVRYLFHRKDVVTDVVTTFERNHLPNRLETIQPAVLLGFGLERRRSEKVAILCFHFLSLIQTIHLFFATLDHPIITGVDKLTVVGLNCSAHVETQNARGHGPKLVPSWSEHRSFDLRPLHPSARWRIYNEQARVNSLRRVELCVQGHQIFGLYGGRRGPPARALFAIGTIMPNIKIEATKKGLCMGPPFKRYVVVSA